MSRFCCCGLLVGLLVFLGPGGAVPATASPVPAPRAPSPPTLTASAVAFELRYGGAARPLRPRADNRNRWLARDKALHVVGSALWTLSTQYVLVNKADWTEGDALPVSLASGATVGLTKEALDATRPTGTASGRDLVANAIGLGLAAGLIAL